MATNFDKSPELAPPHESDISQEEKSGSEQIEEIKWNIEKILENNGALTSEKLEALLLPWLEKAKQSAIENEINARIDALTGLPNRRAFEEAMEIEISRFKRKQMEEEKGIEIHHNTLYGVKIDLDFFKNINDTFGHDIGDEYLKKITEHVRGSLRNLDTFARVGGDEFVVLMPGVDPKNLKDIQERLLKAVREGSTEAKEELMRQRPDLNLKEGEANVSASMGLALFDGKESAKEFLKRADDYCYVAKNRGRNQAIDDLKVEEIRLERGPKGE